MNEQELREYIEYLWGRPPKGNPADPACVKYYAALTAMRQALNDRTDLIAAIEAAGAEAAVQYTLNAVRQHQRGNVR